MLSWSEPQRLIQRHQVRHARVRHKCNPSEPFLNAPPYAILQQGRTDALMPEGGKDCKGIQVVLTWIRLGVVACVLNKEGRPVFPEGAVTELLVQGPGVGEQGGHGSAVHLRHPGAGMGVERVRAGLALGDAIEDVEEVVVHDIIEVPEVHSGHDALGKERGIGGTGVADMKVF